MPPLGATAAFWICLAVGLLFLVRGTRLLRTERRAHRRPLRGEPFSGPEVLWEGGAFATIGLANLLGGAWIFLVFPSVVVVFAVGIRALRRRIRRRRDGRGADRTVRD